MARGHPPKPITGQRFGRLVALRIASKTPRREAVWLCQCDCGKEHPVSRGNLMSGKTQSCGCLHDEVARKNRRTHGASGTQVYKIWVLMHDRCRTKNAKTSAFKNYASRGISVCARWGSFEAFAADMGPRPSDKHSIDRINNDGDYEPSNCRWATPEQQARNKSTTRLIEAFGRKMIAKDWADQVGVNIGTLKDRLKRGWTAEDAISIPTNVRHKKVYAPGAAPVPEVV